MICWHKWEEPAYNKALNLREGLKLCQKCSSVKGFKRFVPIDYENLNLQEPTRFVDLKKVVFGFLLVFVAFALLIIFYPRIEEVTDRIEANPMVSRQSLALFRLIPTVGFMVILMAGIGLLVSGVRSMVVRCQMPINPEENSQEEGV